MLISSFASIVSLRTHFVRMGLPGFILHGNGLVNFNASQVLAQINYFARLNVTASANEQRHIHIFIFYANAPAPIRIQSCRL